MCTEDPLLHREARETASLRHITDTHRALLKTPHENTQPASKHQHNRQSHNHKTQCNPPPQTLAPGAHQALQRDIPPRSEALTHSGSYHRLTLKHRLKAQSCTWNRNIRSNNFISTTRALRNLLHLKRSYDCTATYNRTHPGHHQTHGTWQPAVGGAHIYTQTHKE